MIRRSGPEKFFQHWGVAGIPEVLIYVIFDEVEKCYAIQAGREIRVFVTPEKINDLESVKLSRKIADNIEDTLNYPGEIKVNVIRETRAMSFAK